MCGPVVLHATRVAADFLGFSGIAMVSRLSSARSVARQADSHKVSCHRGVLQLHLRVSRYTVQLCLKGPEGNRWILQFLSRNRQSFCHLDEGVLRGTRQKKHDAWLASPLMLWLQHVCIRAHLKHTCLWKPPFQSACSPISKFRTLMTC